LVPLEHLIDGTRRFAREDFAQPVRFAGNDEFGQLAHSMNHMASRLARQIGAMRALSDIDQKILTQLDIRDVIEGVHARLLELLPRCIPAVFVFDDREAGFGTVHIPSQASEPRTQFKVPIQARHLTGFQQSRDGVWMDVDGSQVQGFVSILAKLGADHCLALPIVSNDNLDGALLIGLGGRHEIDNELIQQASDLASRVGVALAAHAREAQLVYRAHHDDLTGLPNRALLQERLQLEMARARRNGEQLAVLFLDLDRFKAVNDTLGHQAGDQVLRVATERLRSCLRDCDTVARFGGDEFVVLLSGLDKPYHAAQIAGQILAVLAQPVLIGDNACFVGASIGVAMFPTDGATVDELLRRADIAMYKAKAAGRGRFIFSEESMNVEQRERSVMERELRKAITLGQLTVMYQPRVDLRDGRLCGAEALVRWHHPELGWVSPAKFIPLAEDLGLVADIGAWILRHVCEQLVQWQTAGHTPGTVSVNVSAKQFTNGRFVAQVADIILSTGVSPNTLQLEITEGVLIESHELVISMLERIKKTGVSIALDDFGTGYSSISYLRRLPVDVLKIDQSFIRDMALDADARSVVQAIIGLAKSLRKMIVAEGVETAAQAALLAQWGCDEGQGYYFGRPLTSEGLRDNMGKRLPLA
jgi:diguanylate cyclase (GGDEF)-like protein